MTAIASSTARGTSGRSAHTRGTAPVAFSAAARAALPSKGSSPVSISKAATPTEYTSAAGPTSSPAISSGGA
jgi:hypothetical protein